MFVQLEKMAGSQVFPWLIRARFVPLYFQSIENLGASGGKIEIATCASLLKEN